jgi:hypothetical protein
MPWRTSRTSSSGREERRLEARIKMSKRGPGGGGMFPTCYGRSQLPSSRQAWHLAEHCRLPVALKAKRITTIAFI